MEKNAHASKSAKSRRVDGVEIRSDIPLPLTAQSYPFDQLTVGESFFIAGRTVGSIGNQRHNAQVRLKCKFVSRTVVEGGVSGVRIWRTN